MLGYGRILLIWWTFVDMVVVVVVDMGLSILVDMVGYSGYG